MLRFWVPVCVNDYVHSIHLPENGVFLRRSVAHMRQLPTPRPGPTSILPRTGVCDRLSLSTSQASRTVIRPDLAVSCCDKTP